MALEYNQKNIRVASEGGPKPVTTTRMFLKFFGSRRMSFWFTDWSFSDMRYLNTKLVKFSEIIAMCQLENLDAECCVRGGWLIMGLKIVFWR